MLTNPPDIKCRCGAMLTQPALRVQIVQSHKLVVGVMDHTTIECPHCHQLFRSQAQAVSFNTIWTMVEAADLPGSGLIIPAGTIPKVG